MEGFESFNINGRILKAIRDMGFEEPTPIQEEAIPLMIDGKEILAQAQTGTGKTAAFGIPILNSIHPSKKPRALVIVPTRELAIQVAEEINELAKYLDVRAIAVYGGQAISNQIKELEKGVEIVVGTPGRLIDHLNRKTLDLTQLDFVILDEADRMFDMGFIEDIDRILSHVGKEVKISLFSATIPPEVRRLAMKYMKNPESVIISEDELTLPSTHQVYINVGRKNKLWALCRILDREKPKAMIFCSTKKMVDILAKRLKSYGYPAEALHGDLTQARREKILKDFRNGKIKILIASDVAARGLDIGDVTHVINYDIPENPEIYVHRIGRTGRAGKSGKAITFVCNDERHLLDEIIEFAGSDIAEGKVPQKRGRDTVRRVWDFDELSDIYGMVKFRINIGSHHGLKMVDLDDFVTGLGIPHIAVGDVRVEENFSEVEIHKDFAEKFLRRIRREKFKGKEVSAAPAL